MPAEAAIELLRNAVKDGHELVAGALHAAGL
jgi:hypothetical protein